MPGTAVFIGIIDKDILAINIWGQLNDGELIVDINLTFYYNR
ncbi:MAG: hypothetical protein PHP06_06360 [Clostridia bacterium]|nr:hypothetical protein [Clostridia bacterium]